MQVFHRDTHELLFHMAVVLGSSLACPRLSTVLYPSVAGILDRMSRPSDEDEEHVGLMYFWPHI